MVVKAVSFGQRTTSPVPSAVALFAEGGSLAS